MLRRIHLRQFAGCLICCLVTLPCATYGQKKADSDKQEQKLEATHEQIAMLVPKHDGKKLTLHSFKLDHSGNVVAAVSMGSQGMMQVYDSDQNLVTETELEFVPTAIAIDPQGLRYASGAGKIAKVDTAGKVMKSWETPAASTESMEERRAAAVERYEESRASGRATYEKQIERIEERIEKIKSKEERSKRDDARVKSYETQLATYQQILESSFPEEPSEQMIQAMMRGNDKIASISVTDQHIFVTASGNSGYDLWRTSLEGSEEKKVLEGLRGCCGQMDCCINEGKIYLASNCAHQVEVFDLDGKELSSFGKKQSGDDHGFASCCNPMNVIGCANGDIVTAESSVGKLKRFNAEGEMVAFIGKAEVPSGCNHVALGFDQSRNRYYILDDTKNRICILEPVANKPDQQGGSE